MISLSMTPYPSKNSPGLQKRKRKTPDVSLVVPAYKEANRLPKSLRKISKFIKSSECEFEVLLLIEKSPDKTLEVAKEIVGSDNQFLVIDNKVHRGKGFATRSGVMKAQGEIIFFMDADLSTPLKEIPRFLKILKANPEIDIVIGSRAQKQSRIIKAQGTIRSWLGRRFNEIVQGLVGFKGIQDTQCGFKVFRKSVAHEIFQRQTLDGFAFDVEVLLLAQKMGFKTREEPVTWVNSGDSKVHILWDPIKMLWDMTKIRRIVKKTLLENPHQSMQEKKAS